MKYIMFCFLMIELMAPQVFAGNGIGLDGIPDIPPAPNRAYAGMRPVKCEASALDVAKYIDRSGWGDVPSQPLKVISISRGDVVSESYDIHSPVSGYTYKVLTIRDQKSDVCIILSVNTN